MLVKGSQAIFHLINWFIGHTSTWCEHKRIFVTLCIESLLACYPCIWPAIGKQLSWDFCPPGLLTHWGRVTHICIGNLTIIGSDNGLSPGRRQAIIWTNAGILLIRPLGTNFSEILIEIHTFSFKKMHLKMTSAKWRLFCLSLNVLILRRGSLLLAMWVEKQWMRTQICP